MNRYKIKALATPASLLNCEAEFYRHLGQGFALSSRFAIQFYKSSEPLPQVDCHLDYLLSRSRVIILTITSTPPNGSVVVDSKCLKHG